MYPKLFEIPFTNLTVWTYGVMMVIGFISAVSLIRKLSRSITPDPEMITNAALYSLVAGVLGARLFYVIHYFDRFKGNLFSVFAIWQGGLELLGGVILALTVIILYLRYHKLPARRYLDILAIALMLALSFGRIGCFMRGCCFGKPTDLPWAVRFPYASHAYHSQIQPNPKRNRPDPQLKLPSEFFAYVQINNLWYSELKPYEKLTPGQKLLVDKGPYRCLPVHPTQLYSSISAALSCLILFLFRRWAQKISHARANSPPLARPGSTFAMMFILYGIARFFLEFLRDDNPFGIDGLTISQNLSIVMIILGIILMAAFAKMKPDTLETEKHIHP